jgi:hypothetical protein
MTNQQTPQIEITNIVYKNQVKRTQSDEYIEITNHEKIPVDVSGWQIASGIGRSKAFTFPQGTILASHSHFEINRVLSSF